MNTFECINIIGLTGQSGSGKTTVSKLFADNGFSVIDADKVSREKATYKPFLLEVSKHYPDCVTDLGLDRTKLASIVFGNREKLEHYTSLIYPYITNTVFDLIRKLKQQGSKYILLDAPTLFESGLDDICSLVVSVTAPMDMKINRIVERDNISRELAQLRLSSQKSEEWFISKSDYHISNDKSINELTDKAIGIINQIKERINA